MHWNHRQGYSHSSSGEAASIGSRLLALLPRLLVASLVAGGCGSAPAPAAPSAPASQAAEPEAFKRITMADLAARIERKDPMALFDANMRDRYEKGHIPGAKWVDVSTFGAADLPADRATPLVFYCFNPQCSASHMAATRAAKLGYADVSVMPEGILAWQKAGKELEPLPR
jgi:rhodanese-related sulfurtransferase